MEIKNNIIEYKKLFMEIKIINYFYIQVLISTIYFSLLFLNSNTIGVPIYSNDSLILFSKYLL